MTDRPLPGGADTAVGPIPGYYPDPSVPGFVRYWGGTTWVPGTSRPAPVAGELLEPPRFTPRQAASQAAAAPSIVPPVVPPPGLGGGAAETGPMYFDQTTGGVSFTIAPQPPGESAAEIELRPRGDVEAHRAAEDTAGAPRLEPVPDPFPGAGPAHFPGPASEPFAAPYPVPAPGSFPASTAEPFSGATPGSFAAPTPGSFSAPTSGSFSGATSGPFPAPTPGSFPESTPGSFSGAVRGAFPGALSGSVPSVDSAPSAGDPGPSRGSGWRADPGAQPGLLDTGGALQPVSWGVPRPAATADPVAELPPVPVPASVPVSASVPVPAPVPGAAPVPVAVAVAQELTAREVGVPAARARESAPASAVALPVQASAQRRKAAAKPAPAPASPAALPAAGLGARLCARLLDAVVVAVVGVAAGVPLAATTLRHLQEKLDQARMAAALTGRQTQVWLVDPVVLGNAAALLAVLALLGFLCEVLPTARTGQTFGKRLMRIRVVEAAQRPGRRPSAPPSLGRSTVRWLVGQLALVLVVGPLWPLLDRRSRRGWQDRAARTRVVRAARG